MKKVICGPDKSVIDVSEVKESNIVIALDNAGKAAYKLQAVTHVPDKYAFVSLKSCRNWSTGSHYGIKEAIIADIPYHEIIVLDNLAELKNYL